MENEKFVFFSDPCHGWIRVKKTLLEALGIAERITPYSYENGEYAYLEEDCDATLFCDTWEKVNDQKIQFETSVCNGSSRIRRFASYKASSKIAQ